MSRARRKRKRESEIPETPLVLLDDVWFSIMMQTDSLRTVLTLSQGCRHLRRIFVDRIRSRWKAIADSLETGEPSPSFDGRLPFYEVMAYISHGRRCGSTECVRRAISAARKVDVFKKPMLSRLSKCIALTASVSNALTLLDKRNISDLCSFSVMDLSAMSLACMRSDEINSQTLIKTERLIAEEILDTILDMIIVYCEKDSRLVRMCSDLFDERLERMRRIGVSLRTVSTFNLLRTLLSDYEVWRVILTRADDPTPPSSLRNL